MKVLWITREDPRSRTRGDLIYTDGLSRALADSGGSITLLCGATAASSFEADGIRYITVPQKLRSRALSLHSPLPSDPFRLAFPEFKVALERLLRSETFEIALVDHAAMGWALPLLGTTKTQRPRFLVGYISHNFEQQVRPKVAEEFRGSSFKKMLLRWDAQKYKVLERRLVRAADFVTAITEDDAAQFKVQKQPDRVLVLPPGAPNERISDIPIRVQTPRKAVIVGSFTWIAKQQNLLNFLQAASASFSSTGIELEVVGNVPKSLMSAASSIFPTCKFTGEVPSIQPFLRDARIGIMPDELGGGFKLKLLDYIFNGIPVASILSQSAGFPLEPDKDFISAGTAPQLVQKIVHYIDDIDSLNRFRCRASSKCERLFSWQDRGRRFAEFLEQTLSTTPAPE